MKIHLAKTAGFCFGVDRAVRICEQLLADGKNVSTYGPIIHNERVVAELFEKGVRIVEDPGKAPQDGVLVIRSHGAAPDVFAAAAARGIAVADATCPFVGAIHRIVENAADEGRAVLIAGDRNHPEVQAIAGYCPENCYIFDTIEQLREDIFPKTGDIPALMVAQTTLNLLQYMKCVESAKLLFSDLSVHDTVCSATAARQEEARRMGAGCDVCIVIGGGNSSNTGKLVDICGENARTFLIGDPKELSADMLNGAADIGVTAGASTPAPQIEEVLRRMSEIINEETNVTGEIAAGETGAADAAIEEAAEETAAAAEEIVSDSDEEEFDFEQALEESLKPMHRNQKVTGVVTEIRANEVVVDIGSKHTGIVSADEMTDDSSLSLAELVKIGDVLDLLVIKTNDQEGITTLSKKRVDSAEGMETLMQASEDGDVLDGYVAELVNKGLIAVVKGVRVFVPASQATLRRGERYDNLLHRNVKLRILEVNPARRRAIGSIRAVAQEELNRKRDVFWATVENGKEYTGTVKSLTSYGAFVDIGGVDGMVHISELSWQRIKNPADVVSVGEEVKVYVREVDREHQRISLGYRKEEDNPWKVLEKTYGVGDTFEAPVVSLTKFGAFVRVMPGVDGLVHISEISEEHVEKASDILSVGDEVMVKLIGVDYDRKRVSLSMKFEGAPVLERKASAAKAEESEPEEIPAESEPEIAAAEEPAEVLSETEETPAEAVGETVEEAPETAEKDGE